MFVLLALIFSLYLFLSPRDTVSEFRAVFSWSIIRRGIRLRRSQFRFSLLALVGWTTTFACIFAVTSLIEESLAVGIMMAISVLVFVGLWKYVSYAFQMKGPRRRYRDDYFRPPGKDFDANLIQNLSDENPLEHDLDVQLRGLTLERSDDNP